MRDTIGIDRETVDGNRIETDAGYEGTFFTYEEDRIGYQTADGNVTVLTDVTAFGDDLAEHVAASLYDDGLDHVAVPFSHPGTAEGAYEFPTATATTRETAADYLIANTRFAIQGGMGQNPVDHLQVLLEEDNPLLSRVEEELHAVPERVDETVTAVGSELGPWGGIVYQKEPLDNILHDEVRPGELAVDVRDGELVMDKDDGTAVPEPVREAMGADVPYTPGGMAPGDVDEDDEPLGEGPWDDQIEDWEE